jgi:hypothetical protein
VRPWQFASPGLPAAGIVLPVRLKVMLNVSLPMMSAPMRSQSGARFALRIHACRSVVPTGNGVPDVIGLGAERNKKLPSLTPEAMLY